MRVAVKAVFKGSSDGDNAAMKATRKSLRLLALAGAFGLLAVLALAPVAVQAQGNQTNSYTLSQQTYNEITRVQKLLSDGKYTRARSMARDLLPRAKNESKYALAVVNQLIANSYMLQKNYDAAVPYLQKIVDLDVLQPQSELSVIENLATIYLTENKYDDSIRLYKEAIAQQESRKQTPDPTLYYHMGLAYSMKNDYKKAYAIIGEAIQKSKVKHQDWYQNWFIAAYKLNDYQKANDIAKQLILNWPKNKDYWTYLANTYLLMHKDTEAAAVYGLMHSQGLFKSKDEYFQLASLYLQQNAPYKAGEMIEEGMSKGFIPKTARNYDTLSGAWIQARAWGKALDALGKEAQLAPTGSVYLRQAAIYRERENYAKAKEAAQNAVNKGGLKKPGQAFMLLGEISFALKDWNGALDAFHKAENYKDQARAAQSWVQYVLHTRKDAQAAAISGGGR